MMLLWAAAGLPLGIHNILAELNGTLAQPGCEAARKC